MRKHSRGYGMLYKYFSLATPENIQSFEALIQRNEVWLSTFDQFNDPFENAPVIENDLSVHTVRNRYLHLKNIDFSSISNIVDKITALRVRDLPVSKINSVITKNFIQNEIGPQLQEYTLSHFRESGVACFSKDGGSPAMWAYYANNHKGAVVKITDFNRNRPDHIVETVSYQTERPIVKLTQLAPQSIISPLDWTTIRYFIATKSIHWEHEQEVRLVVRNICNTLYELPGNKVLEVVIGARASEAEKTLIKDIAPNVECFQARPCKSEYRIIW